MIEQRAIDRMPSPPGDRPADVIDDASIYILEKSVLMIFDKNRQIATAVGAEGSLDIVISALQLRAARALLGIDQRQLAKMSGVSIPTIQRMEASAGNVRGVIDTLTKVIEALDRAGIEIIGENGDSRGRGRGVRLKEPRSDSAAS